MERAELPLAIRESIIKPDDTARERSRFVTSAPLERVSKRSASVPVTRAGRRTSVVALRTSDSLVSISMAIGTSITICTLPGLVAMSIVV